MKDVLKQAQDLLKVAKEDPKQFQELTKARSEHTEESQRKADLRDKKIKKADDTAFGTPNSKPASAATHPSPAETKPGMNAGKPGSEKKPTSKDIDLHKEAMPAAPMKKDDKPHPAQSAPAHAHNVAEGDESLHHALKILDTPEKQKAMLTHLHTIHGPAQQRSPENRAAGGVPPQAPAHKPAPAPAAKPAHPAAPVSKAEILSQAQALLKAAKEDPKRFEAITKAVGAPAAPAMPKAPAPKAPGMGKPAGPKPPGMGQPAMPKPAGMRMSKEEIKADLAKPWQPKHKKAGC